MIRKPTLDDVSNILLMAIQFNDLYYHAPLNLEKAVVVITYCIEDGVAFISDKGFIGGCIVEDLMRDITIMQEVAWYSTGRDGIALLNSLISASKELDVDELRVCTLETSPVGATVLLKRRGFVPLERSYRLEM